MCKGNTSHEVVGDPYFVNTAEATGFSADENHRVAVVAYRCSVCFGVCVGIVTVPSNVMAGNLERWIEDIGGFSDDDFTWRPRADDTKDYPDVPTHIAGAATEAFECQSDGHYRAAILLARSVIEATAKDKGITSGNLKTKIDAMTTQGLVRPHIEAVAHSIRGYGNDMAHGDFVVAVDSAESALLIQLMGEILDEVYQSPARLAAAQQALANRQQSGGQQ
jgi:Domain of unknown function (DUF4145)